MPREKFEEDAQAMAKGLNILGSKYRNMYKDQPKQTTPAQAKPAEASDDLPELTEQRPGYFGNPAKGRARP